MIFPQAGASSQDIAIIGAERINMPAGLRLFSNPFELQRIGGKLILRQESAQKIPAPGMCAEAVNQKHHRLGLGTRPAAISDIGAGKRRELGHVSIISYLSGSYH
jgi:hypothetical protein